MENKGKTQECPVQGRAIPKTFTDAYIKHLNFICDLLNTGDCKYQDGGCSAIGWCNRVLDAYTQGIRE